MSDLRYEIRDGKTFIIADDLDVSPEFSQDQIDMISHTNDILDQEGWVRIER